MDAPKETNIADEMHSPSPQVAGWKHADDDSPCDTPIACSYVRLVWLPSD